MVPPAYTGGASRILSPPGGQQHVLQQRWSSGKEMPSMHMLKKKKNVSDVQQTVGAQDEHVRYSQSFG